MRAVRLSQFLASTAVSLLLVAAAGSASAEPKSGTQMEDAAAASTTALEPDRTSTEPTDSAKDSMASPATVEPRETSGPPAALDTAPAAAAITPNADPSTAEPKTATAPAPTPQAASAEQADQVPTGTVDTPPADTSNGSPPAAPVPAAVAEIDIAITAQLHDLANGKFDRLVGGKKERPAIDAFYSARNYAPLWITDGKSNGRAKAAIAYLGHVDTDGLDPAEYPVPNFESLSDPAALAEAELKLTTSVVTYAHHAQVGRVHWTRVSGDIFYDRKSSTAAEVLAKLAEATNVAEALAAYEPRNPAYLALKAKLAELRAGKEVDGQTSIPNGPLLKIGMQDNRVPQLRERLHVGGEGTTYDKPLADAVAKYQQEHELKGTGTLTPPTVEALNGRRPDRPVDTIIANLERWRWMPHELGKTYVMVNLPDFTLHVMQNGHELWVTRIVDGKPNLPTPIMSAEMKYITVNPTWNVPPSIIAREYMPIMQQDSTALERMGLKVSMNSDGTVHIAQPPGERNALGRLRFNFPNKFLVYQHDTPEKRLFTYDRRAFSHGCMRVQDPVKYAEVLLSIVRPHDGYTQQRIRSMFGNNEQDIQFPTFIPVHLTYQTAFVDDEGKLVFRDDVYGRDKALLAILKSDERKVADIAIERKENVVRRELLAMPDQSTFGGRGYYGGGDFFSRLFGGQASPQPVAGQRRGAAQSSTEYR
jgi:murein L,D-transpeptidase YcbB/YkuD